ncbi:MAG: hypothetical protein AAF715_21245 [Myxococcota bacterium]
MTLSLTAVAVSRVACAGTPSGANAADVLGVVAISALLRKNELLRDVHAGRRAFVLGNGPSLAHHDLARLAGEVAIVVNQFQRHPQYEALAPPYWMLADPWFWEKPQEYLLPVLEALVEGPSATRLFCPLGGAPVLSALTTGPLVETHFFAFTGDHVGTEPLDFTCSLPMWGQNVISPAIMLALYLGCDPVILIGCDHDFLAIDEAAFSGAVCGHGFPTDRRRAASDRFDWNTWSFAMRRTVWEYERLRDYAAGWGRRIFNATPGGHLETFPRVDFERICDAAPPSPWPSLPAGDLARRAVTRLNEGALDEAEAILELLSRRGGAATEHVFGTDALRAVCAARRGDIGRARRLATYATATESDDPAGLAASLLAQLEDVAPRPPPRTAG